MVRLEDIAVAVGVTATTVANALKGRGNVSELTRIRIIACAQELGYRPNELARSLVQGKTFTLWLSSSYNCKPVLPGNCRGH